MCTYYSYKNLQINPFDLIGINVKHNFFFSPELMQREKPRYALSLSLSKYSSFLHYEVIQTYSYKKDTLITIAYKLENHQSFRHLKRYNFSRKENTDQSWYYGTDNDHVVKRSLGTVLQKKIFFCFPLHFIKFIVSFFFSSFWKGWLWVKIFFFTFSTFPFLNGASCAILSQINAYNLKSEKNVPFLLAKIFPTKFIVCTIFFLIIGCPDQVVRNLTNSEVLKLTTKQISSGPIYSSTPHGRKQMYMIVNESKVLIKSKCAQNVVWKKILDSIFK